MKTSEIWKAARDGHLTVYADTSGGTIQFELGREAANVWLACDGAQTVSGLLADREDSRRARKCIADLVQAGLLACRPQDQRFC